MVKKKSKVSRFRQVAKDADQELEKRAAEDYKNRGSSGKYGSFFTDEMPLKKWVPGEGDHVIDIIPFLAGANHPKLKEDAVAHCLDIYAHRGIGPNEQWIICHARTYGQPCPICKHQAVMRKQGTYTDDEINDLNPSRRVVYNIVCLDSSKDENEGVQLWEVSHFLFGKYLTSLARNKRTGGFIPFSSAEVGKTIEFTKEGKGMKTAYSALMFSDRDPLDDDVLDQAISIDDYFDIKTYEEIEELFFGGLSEEKEEEEEEVEEKPSKRVKKKPVKEEIEEDEEEEVEEDEEVEEEEEIEEEVEEEVEEPKKRTKLRRRTPVKEEEEEEEEEEPKRRTRKRLRT